MGLSLRTASGRSGARWFLAETRTTAEGAGDCLRLGQLYWRPQRPTRMTRIETENGRIAPCGRRDLSTGPSKTLRSWMARRGAPVRSARPGKQVSAASQFPPRLREKHRDKLCDAASRGRSTNSPTHQLTRPAAPPTTPAAPDTDARTRGCPTGCPSSRDSPPRSSRRRRSSRPASRPSRPRATPGHRS